MRVRLAPNQINIIKIKKLPRTPAGDGQAPVATFDAYVNGLYLSGCAIVRRDDGGMSVMTPRNGGTGTRAVWINDDTLQREFGLAAAGAWFELTGKDITRDLVH